MTTPGLAAGGGWRAAARGGGLLSVAADGSEQVATTIFAEMSALAARTGAINLGQGFPDVDGPAWIAEAAVTAIHAGHNQYPPGPGIAELRRAVADHQRRHYGLQVDPDTEVLITTGATEALAAALLALVGPGDEVITLEPFYDSYGGVIGLAGAAHLPVGLIPSPEGFRLDAEALRAAASPRTRLILVNTPHNPTGAVLDVADLAVIAEVAADCDAIVLTDEVYEHLTFDDAVHTPIATLPGMAARTLTVSSAGKTFSFTGWKIGWLHGPAELVAAVRTVKQFLTYVSGAPFQPAIARALADDDTPRALASSLAARRDLLCEGLEAAGFDVAVPRGTYFVVADGAPLGFPDGADLCRRLPDLAGVVAIPMTAFCRSGSPTHDALRSSLRFTFVKRSEVLRQAVDRLTHLRR
ncbi:MAG: pyridoxal phosphate-dependent aminotransferase [Propionicimonas sp.]